jgi:hypothetical protein
MVAKERRNCRLPVSMHPGTVYIFGDNNTRLSDAHADAHHGSVQQLRSFFCNKIYFLTSGFKKFKGAP